MTTSLPMSLFVRACLALHMTQTEISALLSMSRSTLFRRSRGKIVTLWPVEQPPLVQAVHRVDPALALEIAAAFGVTAESMGIAPKAEPPKPEPVKPELPKPEPFAPHLVPHLVHAVVAAAADVAGQPPAALRQIVRAAFERAQAVGLTVEAVAGAMGDEGSGTPDARPRPSKGPSRRQE
jgi:hypothetical protein